MTSQQLDYGERTHQLSDDVENGILTQDVLTMSDLILLSDRINTSGLQPKDIKKAYALHLSATETFVKDAFNTLAQQAGFDSTEFQTQRATNDFYRTVEGLDKIDYDQATKKKLVESIIKHSLLTPSVPDEIRLIAAKVVLNVGDTEAAEQAKINRITKIHKKADKKPDKEGAVVAEQLLRHLGSRIITVEKPSIKDSFVEHVSGGGKKLVVKAAIAGVTLSILAPGAAAYASDPNSQPNPLSQGQKVANNEVGVSTKAPSAESKNVAPTISLSDPSDTTRNTSSDVQVRQALSSEKKKAQTISSPSNTPEAPAVPQPQTISLAPESPTTPLESHNVIVDVAPQVDTVPSPDASSTTPAPEATPPPVVLTPEAPAIPESSSQTEKTTGQLKAQDIFNQLSASGDIQFASSRLVDGFGINADPTTNGPKPTPIVANPDLLAHIQTLERSYQDLITAGGHSDVTYINTSLMTLSVLDAIASDPVVWKSQDVQNLVANAKAPTDPYKAKVFADYLKQAQDTLEAPGSTLLNNIDVSYKTQIEIMYAYALMADTTDLDQVTKAAAEKAAADKLVADKLAAEKAAADKLAADKAAAEKAAADKAAADAGAETSSSPNQILLTAINQAAAKFGWSNNKTILLTIAAQNGASAAVIAGFGGNVFAESGFDPAKTERGSGIGLGYIQESHGRRTLMEAAAKAEGADVADPTWQANYVIRESKQRPQRNHSNKNEWAEFINMTDPVAAADYWLYNSERAGVPHSATREAMATEIYNQINGEIQSIEAAQAAAVEKAKEAAAAAAAEAQAKAEANANILKPIQYLLDLPNGTVISTAKEVQLMPKNAHNGGGDGQCTSWVYIAKALMGHPLPPHLGDAKSWAENAGANYTVDSAPAVGSVMQMGGDHQHVALVVAVGPDSFTVSEMNKKGFGSHHIDKREVPNSDIADKGIQFIHDK